MTDKEFFERIKNDVIKDMKTSGILASLTAAQAFLESSKGNSKLSQAPYNNLFGMKGTYQGQSVTMKTKEFINGKYVVVDAAFRKYPDWETSIKDHSSLFNRLYRYKNLRGLKDYKLACQYVFQDGYANGPGYDKSLQRIIETYKLYEWDKQDPEPVDLDLVQAINVIADRVIEGKFGSGHDVRKENIYVMVRKRVNEILS